ncbi:hypothetical protein SAMN05443575_3416 [Jatrophihabitans endophyticus]|uniref:Uncharacterized protein n=1 Tax=Jatrophihabitans endophyticus TaxID=1206085 RepID=A0A1M5R119_9ACTN|nr:hypothetical protein [Jatrophihabitans endophyticus]SHH20137.1 hypothetical protein SAMN05443575_3416 [Jatrophihabitans endophyticus]
MYTAVWNVDVDGRAHEVTLKWTYWGGERDVYLDGELVAESTLLLRWKSDQEIDIDGHTARVVTRPHSLAHPDRFTLVLDLDGVEHEPDENRTSHGIR